MTEEPKHPKSHPKADRKADHKAEPKVPPAEGAPAAPAAKPAPRPPVKLPEPVFNASAGNLLMPDNRYWPTDQWKSPWSRPSFRNAALLLAGIVFVAFGASAAIGELSRPFGFLYQFLGASAARAGLPPQVLPGVWILVKVLAVVGLAAGLSPLFFVWWERKISAHMQSRYGPMNVGGWHGWAQTIADTIKLMLKEDVTPILSDRLVHRLAPMIVTASAILAFAPVTFGKDLVAADIDIGTLYIFAVTGVSVLGIVMAGWASGNKYSLLGGLRSAAQLVSYELPRVFSVVPVIMFSGSLNLTVIAQAQSGYWGGILPRWFIFYPVVGQLGFLIFLIASVAETNRIPFDIPEAESELVSGFHTEYSGMKFSLFFLGEYAYVLLGAFLTATFFLGGGAAPAAFLQFIPSWMWFLVKVFFIIFCFMWFRWTFPRLRVDRLMDFNWKFLLPWSFANIAFAGLLLFFFL